MYIHSVLREALSRAVENQLVPRNIAAFIDTPKLKKYRASVLNENEVQALLGACKNTKYYIPVLLGVALDLRRGEALGLQWKDIDYENKTMHINRSLLPTENGLIFHDPKTEGSNRLIVVSATVLDLLKAAKEQQEKYKAILGAAYNDNDLVSCLEDGNPINPSTFSQNFGRMLKRNNLPQIRFHDLRNTNATLMLKQNVPAKVASEKLGHSTVGITLDLYSHVLKEMQVEAAEKLDSLLFSNEGEKNDDI